MLVTKIIDITECSDLAILRRILLKDLNNLTRDRSGVHIVSFKRRRKNTEFFFEVDDTINVNYLWRRATFIYKLLKHGETYHTLMWSPKNER